MIVKTDCETNGSSAALVVLLSANVGEVYLAAAGNTEYTQFVLQALNNKCEHGTKSFDAQQTHETLRGITFCVSSSLII